jgi:hypothetical protein
MGHLPGNQQPALSTREWFAPNPLGAKPLSALASVFQPANAISATAATDPTVNLRISNPAWKPREGSSQVSISAKSIRAAPEPIFARQ